MTTPPDSGAESTLVITIRDLFQQLTWQGGNLFARRIERVDLTVAQYRVLSLVNKLGPMATMGQLSDTLRLPKSSVTSITDRLVALNLVERATVAGDRRAVGATITPAGSAIVAKIDEMRTADLTRMMDGLTNEDLQHFATVLAALLKGVERLLKQPEPGA